MKKGTFFLSALLCLLLNVAGVGLQRAEAADAPYPTKSIDIIVPAGAGGGTDMIARALANRAKDILGKPVVIVNKPGGSGSVGFTAGQTAKPDGYTVTMFFVELVVLPHLGTAPADYTKFEPIMMINADPAAFTVAANAPWNTLEEFTAYTKANPGKVRMANSGSGSGWHLTAVAFEQKTGVQFAHIPFNGAAPGVTALLGGNVEAIAVSPAEVGAQVAAGKLKMLAIASEKRSKNFPNVPTFKERGIDVVMGTWRGLGVPLGTPPAIVTTLHDAFKKSMEDPVFVDQMDKADLGLRYMNAEDTKKFFKSEYDNFGVLTEKVGLKKK
jgi:tripartite-type tricarboxylate transporter receptor subunit TctC